MAVVNDLEKIAAWMQENICRGVALKVPDDKHPGADYTYTLIEPTAWPLYIPSGDRKPPAVAAPFPCILVRIISGEEKPKQGTDTIEIMLNFITWNPGQHGPDVYEPAADGQSYRKQQAATFTRNMEGWKDVWSFIDRARRIIKNAEYIAGMRVLSENGIKYGPSNEADTTNELYPYYAAYMSFSLERGSIPADFEDLL